MWSKGLANMTAADFANLTANECGANLPLNPRPLYIKANGLTSTPLLAPADLKVKPLLSAQGAISGGRTNVE